ncbi:hypothetical protein [Bacillus velezensis]|uniref:hypothetical protein n=1 Tax=Bacillus velezensis TaxID=492670 RepID=UPI001F29CF00|nr:hypothetical protein [Bacillus velezensis]UJA34263.1 hypothetical protein L0961_10540 [Bacillus velezensis]
MDNRSININNSSLTNSPFNTGDNASQTVNAEGIQDENQLLFNQLIESLKAIPDEEERTDAEENTRKLQDAVNKGNKSRAKRIFGWLPTTVTGTSVALQIYKIIESL